jgi:hypothetical protein
MLTDDDIIKIKDRKFRIKSIGYKTFDSYYEAKREINRLNTLENLLKEYYEKIKDMSFSTIDEDFGLSLDELLEIQAKANEIEVSYAKLNLYFYK